MQWFLKSVEMISMSLERVSPEIQLNWPGPAPLLPRARTKLPLGRNIWILPFPLSPTRMNPEFRIVQIPDAHHEYWFTLYNSHKSIHVTIGPLSSTAKHSGCWNCPRCVPRKPKTTISSPFGLKTLIRQLPESTTATTDPSGETLKKKPQKNK